jgi:SAM-dependent methyltransferase
MDRGGGEASPLDGYRDGVLARAEVAAGDVLLDVGAGAGLVGLGALDRVGPTGQVIFSDVSADLLAECRRRAEAAGATDRCRFVQAGADDLGPVPDASVDVVTTRSVLMYVADRPAAFAEAYRVLRPGGRLSIFEPVNGFAVRRAARRPFGIDAPEVADLSAKLVAALGSGAADDDPMVNFDEHDLLRWAEAAGFTALELDFRVDVDVPQPAPATDWETLASSAPNPLAPTLAEAIAAALTKDEQRSYERAVRVALAERRPVRHTMATAFLRAVRP